MYGSQKKQDKQHLVRKEHKQEYHGKFDGDEQANGYYVCGMRANGYERRYQKTIRKKLRLQEGIEGLSFIYCKISDPFGVFDQINDEIVIGSPMRKKVFNKLKR